jgi:Bacterial toxin 37
LLALAACSSTTKVVRLNTGEGEPIVFTPRVRGEPVKLDPSEVKRALAQLVQGMNVPVAPQEAARRLFEVGERSGWYQYNPRNNHLTPLGTGEHLQVELSAAEAELTRSYLALCEARGARGDCLRLLVESPTITGDGRYALAMSFAKGAVLDEMQDAFKGMANPEAVLTAVLWTCTTYLLLWTAPEPVSKGIAAVLTAALIAWVGFDTFWSLIVGFKQLVDEADRATTFAELRQAGERYGKVMGRNAARAFVILATAAIGNTAAGLATKVPTLPGAAQAATQAGTQLGISLSAVGAVTAVAVSADAVTISVASGAVMLMDAQAPGIPTAADGFTPPKRWNGNKVKSPNGNEYGYPDSKGNVWVPTGAGPKAHGGPHWDVQHPDGSHTNVYPGGKVR